MRALVSPIDEVLFSDRPMPDNDAKVVFICKTPNGYCPFVGFRRDGNSYLSNGKPIAREVVGWLEWRTPQ